MAQAKEWQKELSQIPDAGNRQKKKKEFAAQCSETIDSLRRDEKWMFCGHYGTPLSLFGICKTIASVFGIEFYQNLTERAKSTLVKSSILPETEPYLSPSDLNLDLEHIYSHLQQGFETLRELSDERGSPPEIALRRLKESLKNEDRKLPCFFDRLPNPFAQIGRLIPGRVKRGISYLIPKRVHTIIHHLFAYAQAQAKKAKEKTESALQDPLPECLMHCYKPFLIDEDRRLPYLIGLCLPRKVREGIEHILQNGILKNIAHILPAGADDILWLAAQLCYFLQPEKRIQALNQIETYIQSCIAAYYLPGTTLFKRQLSSLLQLVESLLPPILTNPLIKVLAEYFGY